MFNLLLEVSKEFSHIYLDKIVRVNALKQITIQIQP